MIDYREEFISGKLSGRGFDEGLRIYMLKIYIYMTIALLITACAAFATLNFEPLTKLIYNITPQGEIYSITTFGVMVEIAPLIIAFSFALGLARMSTDLAQLLFWVYAALIGMSLSSLGIIYTGRSLTSTFLICSSLFGLMSLYGYTTKNDLTSVGSFLVMGLMGLVLISFINIFLRSSSIDFATSFIGIVIFMGLTAWDAQKIKDLYYFYKADEEGKKPAIIGAFSLYLDFINLFLSLLNIFGNKKDR